MFCCRVWLLLSLSFLLVISRQSKALTQDNIKCVDNFIEEVLNCTGIPGLSLAAVKDGNVVLSKGYGKANLIKGTKVDHTTLFNIGSITKSFTAALIARLLQTNNRFNWNTPIRDIIGDWFHLYNGFYSNHTTLRDILAMKTGLHFHDGLWMTNTYSRKELIQHVRFLEPAIPFRSNFLYNNIMYTVAGFAAEEMGGATWEELVKQFIFDPIGMKSTSFIDQATDNFTGFASPYSPSSKRPWEVIPAKLYQVFRSVGPAGSIASNADDMAKWLLFWLNNATTGSGEHLLSEEELEEFLKPDMSIDPRPGSEPVLFVPKHKYAKGFYTGFYRDLDLISHSGAMIGYYSRLHILPGANIGSFVAFNYDGMLVMRPILNYVDDLLLGKTPWLNATYICNLAQGQGQYGSPGKKNYNFPKSQNPLQDPELAAENYKYLNDTSPTAAFRPLDDYIGKFGNFLYGNITIYLDKGNNVLKMNQGEFGRFDLVPSKEERNVFTLVGNESPAEDLDMWESVQFQTSDNHDNVIDTLVWPMLNTLDPPYFIRGLKMTDAGPPDIHSCN